MAAALCLSSAASCFAQTNLYSVAGVYNIVVPAGASFMSAKLWGAGGGNGIFASGGGGAFVRIVRPVIPGEGYVVVVGQRGAQSSAALGGAGSGNTEGGAPGFLGDYNERGQGGQASSLFNVTNGLLVMKAVAGGGGGAGRNAGGGGGGQAGSNFSDAEGGQPGADGSGGTGAGNGSRGGDYVTDVSSLSLAGGNGGNGENWSGGGGGGYGGGGGGGAGTAGNGAGGAGGGSFGDFIVNGNGPQAGNASDPDYVAGAASAATDGLVIISFPSGGSAPIAATAGATETQIGRATLNAVIIPGNSATTYYFQYGTNTNYGYSAPARTLAAGTSAIAVSNLASGLTPGTRYYFRIVASNSFGVVTGLDSAFTTIGKVCFQFAGVYTNVVPPGASRMTVKLWGAGGGGSALGGDGGGGAFSSVGLDVTPGERYVIVVGQRGAQSGASLGGTGSGNTQGGAPGFLGDYNHRGQGGQASSLFQLTSNFLVLKAVAGAGGGAGIGRDGGAGGRPGANGSSAVAGQPGSNGSGGTSGGNGAAGADFASGATTAGISSLNLASGNGGNAGNWSGGGGGGYGGGGGGGGGSNGSGAGGGGGGSYGDTMVFGNAIQPGNTSDPDYANNVGRGGAGGNPGNDGAVVLLFSPMASGGPILMNPTRLGNGSFQFFFTNQSGAHFTAFGTTNISLAASNWTVLGLVPEISPGQFQFTDPQTTNLSRRFYYLRSP